jgi:hypothetical protein
MHFLLVVGGPRAVEKRAQYEGPRRLLGATPPPGPLGRKRPSPPALPPGIPQGLAAHQTSAPPQRRDDTWRHRNTLADDPVVRSVVRQSRPVLEHPTSSGRPIDLIIGIYSTAGLRRIPGASVRATRNRATARSSGPRRQLKAQPRATASAPGVRRNGAPVRRHSSSKSRPSTHSSTCSPSEVTSMTARSVKIRLTQPRPVSG